METKNSSLIFFDFDGVIADTFGLGLSIHNMVNPHLTADDYKSQFNANIFDSIKNRKVGDFMPIEEFPKHYGAKILDQALFPGIKQVTERLSQKYPLVIVTSTWGRYVTEFLKQHKMANSFSEILGHDVHPSKVIKITDSLGKYQVEPQNAIMITDTAGDVYEARKAGVDSIGVAWGFHSIDDLGNSKPMAIVESAQALEDEIHKHFKNGR